MAGKLSMVGKQSPTARAARIVHAIVVKRMRQAAGW